VTHPYLIGTRYPRVFAHRGLVPPDEEGIWENSLAAFAAAQAAGAKYIESDCRVTAEGDVVLFHDATLARVTGDSRAVASVRTDELRELFSDHGGLLTVPEALEAFPTTRFNLDVKSDAVVDPLGPALAAHTPRVLVTSFSD